MSVSDLIPPEYGLWTSALNWVWDVNTLEYVPMEQPVIEGSTITVGAVDQGAAGVSPWLIALPTGASTAARQDTGNTSLTNLLAELQLKADLTETQPVSLASVPSHNVTNAGTFAVQATQAGTWDEVGINDSGNSITVDAPVGTPVFVRLSDGIGAIATLPISAASLPLPTNAATSALQTQPGVDIGDVTVNNAAGASAVNIQDGGNTITVDASNLDIRDLTFAADKVDASGSSVTASVTGSVTAAGAKSHNAVVPGATNLGTLPAIATAAAPTYVEGNQVGLSTDLAGNVRISGSISASTSATATEDDPTYTEGASENLSQDLGGRLRTLSYAQVNDAPSAYVPSDMQPFSMTTDGRIRVAVADARVAEAPFNDDMRSMWGDLRPWENGPGKPFYDGSPWANW